MIVFGSYARPSILKYSVVWELQNVLLLLKVTPGKRSLIGWSWWRDLGVI